MNTLKLTPMTAVFLIASLLALSCGEKDKTMGPTIDEIEIIETDHSQDEPAISYDECVAMAEITELMKTKAADYTAASQTAERDLYNCAYVYASTRDKYFDNPKKLAARIYLLGFRAVYLSPGKNGKINLDELYNAVDGGTVLVSVMAVNNEIGSIQEISKIKDIIKAKKSGAYFHCDAVQAFGKIPLTPKKYGIDLMSVSAHKIHGVKGAGALFVSSGVKITPVTVGGGQENGIFSGTEPMPAICAFAAAVGDLGSIDKNLEKAGELKSLFLEKLKNLDKVYVNSPGDALPYIINISVEGVPSQVMLNSLSAEGIYVSAGSACSKGHRSSVLAAVGVAPKLIDCALRISLSKNTTENDMDLLYNGIVNAVKRIRR